MADSARSDSPFIPHPSSLPSNLSCKSETFAYFYATEIPFLQILLSVRGFHSRKSEATTWKVAHLGAPAFRGFLKSVDPSKETTSRPLSLGVCEHEKQKPIRQRVFAGKAGEEAESVVRCPNLERRSHPFSTWTTRFPRPNRLRHRSIRRRRGRLSLLRDRSARVNPARRLSLGTG